MFRSSTQIHIVRYFEGAVHHCQQSCTWPHGILTMYVPCWRWRDGLKGMERWLWSLCICHVDVTPCHGEKMWWLWSCAVAPQQDHTKRKSNYEQALPRGFPMPSCNQIACLSFAEGGVMTYWWSISNNGGGDQLTKRHHCQSIVGMVDWQQTRTCFLMYFLNFEWFSVPLVFDGPPITSSMIGAAIDLIHCAQRSWKLLSFALWSFPSKPNFVVHYSVQLQHQTILQRH